MAAAPAAPTVRPLAGAEVDALARLSRQAFGPPGSDDAAAARWRRSLEEAPDFDPAQIRGAVRDGALLGGYVVFERWLRLGPAELLTGCIGSVVTAPEHRNQGVARALLLDAIDFGRARGHALLLLDGIADFYHRFGFADVWDPTDQLIDRRTVMALPTSPYRVRPAELDDAAALLAAYERHHGPVAGSFRRDLAMQRHRLAARLPDNPPWLAVDADGAVRGYLLVSAADRARAMEVAADDWPALLALLRRHAELLGAAGYPAAELLWRLRPGSSAHFDLADRLPLQSRSASGPNAGWMARPADLAGLVEALGRSDPGSLGARLRVDGVEVAPGQRDDPAGPAIELTGGGLAQLLFGYRPPDRLLGPDAPAGAAARLAALFPRQLWIPGSDYF